MKCNTFKFLAVEVRLYQKVFVVFFPKILVFRGYFAAWCSSHIKTRCQLSSPWIGEKRLQRSSVNNHFTVVWYKQWFNTDSVDCRHVMWIFIQYWLGFVLSKSKPENFSPFSAVKKSPAQAFLGRKTKLSLDFLDFLISMSPLLEVFLVF